MSLRNFNISRISIHAGHNPDGMTGCGAAGYFKESTEARDLVAILKPMLEAYGIMVTDVTVNDGKDQNDVLKRLCARADSTDSDLNISVHFNASEKHNASGTECYVWKGSDAVVLGSEISAEISRVLGITDRGVKQTEALYFLHHTEKPGILIEVCFCDNGTDAAHYDRKTAARAIADAVGRYIGITDYKEGNDAPSPLYRVQCGAFTEYANAAELKKKLTAAGFEAVIMEV